MIIDDVKPQEPTKILHVEDDETITYLVKHVLEREGFEVVSAFSPSEAVAKAQGSKFGLVLMDIVFGDGGINGIEAARLIKRDDPQKPIIFVSAYFQDPAFHEQIRNAGLESAAFFRKLDLTPSSLLQVVKEIVAPSGTPDSLNHSSELEEKGKVEQERSEPNLFPHVYQLDHIDLGLYSQLQAHPELLKVLDWRLFEELIADIVRTFGYTVDLTRPTKDGGIDVIALGKPEPWGMHRYLIQAKQSGKRIGIKPVRELMFLHNDLRATRSCLVATSAFTRGAWELSSQYQWQLELRDYDGLKEWVEKAARIKRGA